MRHPPVRAPQTRGARAFIRSVMLVVALAVGCRGDTGAPAATGTPGTPAAPADSAATIRGPTQYVATVVRSYPHDPSAFTEGLFIHAGRLFESTGLKGTSEVREVDLATGAVRRRTPLDRAYFGEGITMVGGTLYQLTWHDSTAFTYDPATLARGPRRFRYPGQGWGMTTDGASLIMSDSTARLRFLDPTTFAARRTLDVYDGPSPVSLLNELEWVKGRILANVWQSQQLAEIDPKTGAVTAWIDAGAIPAAADKTGREDVLNGIAYDAAADKLYLTGKYYSRLYEVRLERR